MEARSTVISVAKLALPLLIGLLWAYRRHLARRPKPASRDEIHFERAYRPLEPESSQPDYVRSVGDSILRFHRIAWLVLLMLAMVAVIVAIEEPLARIILGVAAIVLVAIVAVWRRRPREARRTYGAAGPRDEAGSGPG